MTGKATVSRTSKAVLAEASLFLFILVGWFASNSFNGIAMQLVRDKDDPSTRFLPHLTIATVITTAQLLLGAVVGTVLLHLMDWVCPPSSTTATPCNNSEAGTATTQHVPPIKPSLQSIPSSFFSLPARVDVIAVLHALGSLATNLGFLYGKASLVQIIKLLEPFETLIFVLLWQHAHPTVPKSQQQPVTPRLVGSMILTVSAAISLVRGHGGAAHPHAALFAVLSGLALSARNVVQRGQLQQKQQQKQSEQIQHAAVPPPTTTTDTNTTPASTPSHGGDSRVVASLTQFQSMSWQSGLILLVPAVMLQMMVGPRTTTMQHLLQQHVQVFVWHPLYNVFSIVMLGLVSALTHSLLNASKRVVSILVAIVWFHETLHGSTVASLVFVLLGGAWYAYESKQAKKQQQQAVAGGTLLKDHVEGNAGNPKKHNNRHRYHHSIHSVVLPLLTFSLGYALGCLRSANDMTSYANVTYKRIMWEQDQHQAVSDVGLATFSSLEADHGHLLQGDDEDAVPQPILRGDMPTREGEARSLLRRQRRH